MPRSQFQTEFSERSIAAASAGRDNPALARNSDNLDGENCLEETRATRGKIDLLVKIALTPVCPVKQLAYASPFGSAPPFTQPGG